MAVDTGTVQVVMPVMGDSVAEGTVLEWHKQEGDSVQADETIVEISTDKVDAEVPSPASGRLVKILAAEGETVAVGAVLAEIATNGGVTPVAGDVNGDVSSPATPVSVESPPATPEEALAAAATEAAGQAQTDAVTGEPIDIVTPTGGESVTEGTILEWAVKVGDTVKDGDTVVEISTDKVDMELPAPTAGTITEILAEDGETVTVGQVIARMVASTAGAPAGDPAGDPAGASVAPAPAAAAPASTPPPATPHRSPAASPLRRASTCRTSTGARAAAGSPKLTCSPPPATGGVLRRRCPRRPPSRSGAAPRHLPAIWTRAARFPPRPRSGPSR